MKSLKKKNERVTICPPFVPPRSVDTEGAIGYAQIVWILKQKSNSKCKRALKLAVKRDARPSTPVSGLSSLLDLSYLTSSASPDTKGKGPFITRAKLLIQNLLTIPTCNSERSKSLPSSSTCTQKRTSRNRSSLICCVTLLMLLMLLPFPRAEASTMKINPFGIKAHRFIMRPYEQDSRITILDGSVRSSKTFSMIPKLLTQILPTQGDKGLGLITGVSKETIKRNILNDLFSIVGEDNYDYNRNSGELDLCEYRIQVVGAKDEGSEKYIRGGTFAWAYGDEISLMPESFFKQLLNRLSVPGSKFYGTTNPDSPFHYLYKEYMTDADKLDSGMVKVLHFVLDDNPSLSREYKDFIRKAYTGVFFQRYILGKWVVAEGAIYKDCWSDAVLFNETSCPHDIRTAYVDRYIGVDYGTTNPCVFGEYLDDGTRLWKMREYYWDSKKEGRQKTDSEYADDLVIFIGSDDNATVILDPSAASFKAELRKRGIFVKDADNEVLDGIRLVSTMFNLGYLRVHEQCTKTIEEHQSYAWNEKRSEKGVEEPVKSNDHTCDETRYVCKTMIKPWRLAA